MRSAGRARSSRKKPSPATLAHGRVDLDVDRIVLLARETTGTGPPRETRTRRPASSSGCSSRRSRGGCPATSAWMSTASQFTNPTTNAAIPRSTTQRKSGMARKSRKKTVSRLRSRSSRHDEADRPLLHGAHSGILADPASDPRHVRIGHARGQVPGPDPRACRRPDGWTADGCELALAYDRAMVERSDVERAAGVIAGRLLRTPMLSCRTLGRDVFLKAELLQRTGSFKPRGVLTKLASLTPEEKARGVIAISAGNHAQAARVGRGAGGDRRARRHVAGRERGKIAATREATARRSTSRRPIPATSFERLDVLLEETGRDARASVRRSAHDRRPGHGRARDPRGLPRRRDDRRAVGGGGLISGSRSRLPDARRRGRGRRAGARRGAPRRARRGRARPRRRRPRSRTA